MKSRPLEGMVKKRPRQPAPKDYPDADTLSLQPVLPAIDVDAALSVDLGLITQLEVCGNYIEAAEALKRNGYHERAAQNYFNANRFVDAAELFTAAGNLTRSREAYTLAMNGYYMIGLPDRAGVIAEGLGLHLDAAKFYKCGQMPERALQNLRKAGIENPEQYFNKME